jgi:hypothetical protein
MEEPLRASGFFMSTLLRRPCMKKPAELAPGGFF